MNALIPWYLNGTLSANERVEMDIWLRESAEAQAELQMWRAVQQDARGHADAHADARARADFGWQRLRRDLKRERWRGTGKAWRLAAAASVLVVVGLQTSILMRQNGGARYEPLSGSLAIPVDAWRVQVRFAESAAITDINSLLLRLDARVIRGPSALGIYEIALPRDAAADAPTLRVRLATEPLLAQVVVTP